MIDPKELRIGNWINAYHNDVQVTSINSEPDHLSLQISTTPTLVGSTHGGMYFPIPLTEEWLIKFGFELKRIDEDDTFERYQLPISKTSWYLANVITYGSVTLFNNRDHTSTGVGAQYVHQLQNLFYALCGEELTIKE